MIPETSTNLAELDTIVHCKVSSFLLFIILSNHSMGNGHKAKSSLPLEEKNPNPPSVNK